MDLFVAQLLNGLVYGVLLFLMAAGLSCLDNSRVASENGSRTVPG